MTVKILLDTDIGGDIDDAVCLAYLLAQPQCELLGVTTVAGNSDQRAQMVSVLCKAAGKDVPIYPGCETPMLVPQKEIGVPQYPGVAKWPHETRFPRGEAVEFLRRTIRRYPGEVVLLTIGPLTNAGLLFRVDPETASLLKGLVIMAGVFKGPVSFFGHSFTVEWTNAGGDPHATSIVYGARTAVHRSIGLDVTVQVRMEGEEVRKRFAPYPLLRPVLDFHDYWGGGKGAIFFHDPLAAATIFDDTICAFERGRVDVEIADPANMGATHWKPAASLPPEEAPAAPHEVAVTVDPERFFEHYFSVFPTR